ncbi:MAG: energy transducer TonB [Roseomonas sp.]|nr:energy transducer TonB [Roseomonas sp.]MCA3318190.1 energy transducer TonB [Roseomonas sp.]
MKAAPSGFGLVASVALHGVIAALLILWPAPEELSGDQAEAQGVSVIYEGAPEIGMVESPAAPPEVAAVPPVPEVPPPPPPMPPPPAVAAAPLPPPPLPVDLAEVMLPPPPPPAPVAEPPPELAEKPPGPPHEVAEAPPERRPPPQQRARQTAAPQPVRLNAALQGMESFTLEGRTSPPEALDAARNRRPNYPEASRRRGEQGVVRVELLVDPNGRVVDVRLLESSGFSALDAEAVKTVRDWRFRPAQRAGVPVAGSITTAVHFRLETARR